LTSSVSSLPTANINNISLARVYEAIASS